MVSIRIIMRRCMGTDKKNEVSVDLVCTIWIVPSALPSLIQAS